MSICTKKYYYTERERKMQIPQNAGLTGFNGILDTFLSELSEILPHINKIKDVRKGLQMMTSSNSVTIKKKPLQMFMNAVTPYKDLVKAEDEVLMTTFIKDISFFKGMNITEEWGKFDADQKQGMWKYLNLLTDMGGALIQIPDSMFPMLDRFTQQLANNPEIMEGMLRDMGGMMPGGSSNQGYLKD